VNRRFLLSPGPFPPVDPPEPDTEDELSDDFDAPEPETELVLAGETIDLGAVFRDRLYTGHHLDGRARTALQSRLKVALESGDMALGADLLTAWADTWSLSAMVDDANEQWSTAPDGWSLAVLARAAEVISLALDWRPGPNGPWPWPDASAVRSAVGPVDADRDCVLARHPLDGAEQLAAMLGLPVEGGPTLELPPHSVVTPETLVERRAELAAALADETIQAAVLTAEPPQTPRTALARGELRLEGEAQAAVDRYGLAGLLAPDAPPWTGLRPAAPAGDASRLDLDTVLDATCDGALVPGPPGRVRRGQLDTVGVLLWVDAHPPVWVAPVAIHVLRGLDGTRSLRQLVEALKAPADALLEVAADLVSVGAAVPV
jgi:hypothetical protein